jgi:CelD/BcsL family acetyltransferase involved in cellulose biosynthesis
VLEPVESHWLFGCPLLGVDAVELLDAFLGEFDEASRPRAVLVSGILPGSRLRRRLAATFERRWQIFVLEPNHGLSASLDGGLDGFLSRRSGRLRRELRRQQRRAGEHGVTFERALPRTAAEVDAVYARVLDVERRSWKGIGRCGMAEPPSRAFYAAMLGRLAASGAGRVVFARRGDDDIGFVFGGVCGSVYRGQQFSYVEQWQGLSIGNLLQVEQVRWLGEEGVGRYDMGPVMDYKRLWTEIETRGEVWLLRAEQAPPF